MQLRQENKIQAVYICCIFNGIINRTASYYLWKFVFLYSDDHLVASEEF